MTTTFAGIDDMKSRVGEHLGYSDWLEIKPAVRPKILKDNAARLLNLA